MSSKVLEERDGRTILKAKILPNSENFEIKGVNPWRKTLKIKVSSPAQKGKANSEIIEELESLTGGKIRILSGDKSREKKISIEGVHTDKIREKLDL